MDGTLTCQCCPCSRTRFVLLVKFEPPVHDTPSRTVVALLVKFDPPVSNKYISCIQISALACHKIHIQFHFAYFSPHHASVANATLQHDNSPLAKETLLITLSLSLSLSLNRQTGRATVCNRFIGRLLAVGR